MTKSKLGLIGLAVMGENLARNIANNGYQISVYNRTKEKTELFINKGYNQNLIGTFSLDEFVSSLETPRKIIIMVKAGSPVDQTIEALKPLLSKGDIVIDCGNSFYRDSQRRYHDLKSLEINFIGCGVSGGEEGALKGPSIMPGGDQEAYQHIAQILKDISAKDFGGNDCVSYIGNDGAGHYVKMVHNGIEYAIMQMMAEGYDLLRKVYNLPASDIGTIFEKYNNNKLNSYLFEIASKVLNKKDEIKKGEFLIDNIRDTAGAKGTGLWTSIEGLEKGLSVSTIIEATLARAISSDKDIRTQLSKQYILKKEQTDVSLEEAIDLLENTLYTGMLIAYAQGLALIKQTSQIENRNIRLDEVTRIWQGGCIIRAKILQFLTNTFAEAHDFDNILELQNIQEEIVNSLQDYKKILAIASSNNIPMPSLSSAYNYLLYIISSNSSANFIQGLRDYFGAHTYQRNDMEGTFHTDR